MSRNREDLTLVPVGHLDDVLSVALLDGIEPPVSVESEKEKSNPILPLPGQSDGGKRPYHASGK